MARTLVSVIVCTHSRQSELASVLARLCVELAPFQSEIEFIVVDTGASTGADRVRTIASRCGRADHMTVIQSPLSSASDGRNAGAKAATGDLLWFLDDDACPRAGWIRAVRKIAADGSAEMGGGPAIPTNLPSYPKWIVDRLDTLWGPLGFYCLNAGELSFLTNCSVLPIGANMFVRREIFERIGGFDGRLGPGKGGIGEDTDFVLRGLEAGIRVRYVPDAWVHHLTSANRLSLFFVLRWYLMKVRFLMTQKVSGARIARLTVQKGLALFLPPSSSSGRLCICLQTAQKLLNSLGPETE